MQLTNAFIKTRIAPTPSGFLHLGNAFSFALTAFMAGKTNAGILLRIDDLDQQRVNDDYLQDIFETLHFLKLRWSEGPENVIQFKSSYSQLHRLQLYGQLLEKLRSGGRVYACSCSRSDILKSNAAGIYQGTCRHKQIPLDAENVCWRLRTDHEKMMHVKTMSGKIVSTLPESMHDFVVRKKDGFPAYQLSSLADDAFFNINLVVRGRDLWDSTLAQLYLAELLQNDAFLNAVFYHHPLLLNKLGNKLSKSAGDTSVQHYRRQHTAAELYGLLLKQAQLLPASELPKGFLQFLKQV